MPLALAILIGCQLVGEVCRDAFHLPLPGPLVGMFLLATLLALKGGGAEAAASDLTSPLPRVANGLISNMGLLFVPAGVGIIVQSAVLRREWLPIMAGLLVSTVLGLVVTGLVMHHVTRLAENRQRHPPRSAVSQELR